MADEQETTWAAVAARSLAFLCLLQADLRDKDLATQGQFLESLGVSRKDAAAMLGTSYASLTELYRQAKTRKKGAKSATKKRR
jgi:hypothetical protein